MIQKSSIVSSSLFFMLCTDQTQAICVERHRMKAITKIVLVGASVLSMGALTACQSTSGAQANKDHPRMMKEHHQARHLSPEQREKFEKMRTEHAARYKQMQEACNGKAVGDTVQIKVADKTIDGTCNMVFKADRKDMKNMRGQHHQMKGEHRTMHGDARKSNDQRGYARGEALTDSKRAELVKQYDQRLAQRQAMQQAHQNACQSKKHGDAVQIKFGAQTINGKCHVRFQPNAPIVKTATKAA